MGTRARFRDRRDAGRQLAVAVAALDLVEPIVLALPRGGVPVGFEVAGLLGAPLDVLVARKVGAPGQPELGISAIAEGGVGVADGRARRLLGITDEQLGQLAEAERIELDRRVSVYRHGRAPPAAHGRDVVIVDDGLATGVTAEAAIGAVRRLGAHRVVLAAPVGAPDTIHRLGAVADLVVCLVRPRRFRAVGEAYDDFEQTSDVEVVELLELARPADGRRAR